MRGYGTSFVKSMRPVLIFRDFYQNAPEYTREGLTKRESDISQRYKCTIGCNEIGDDLMVEA